MILAIVQARMSSNRLQGKVLKEVMGKPLIGYLLERLSASKRINKIIVATTTDKDDDVVYDYVKSLQFDVYRGSNQNVLSRYYFAAVKYKPDSVMRITADCPLIDPGICDRLIDFYIKEKADYACLSQRFAEGLDSEIFTFKVLEDMHKNAKKKSEREHVSLFLHNNPGMFNKRILDNAADDSKYRITVDEPEDFEVVKTLIENLYKANSDFLDFQAIKKFLDKNPEISRKNSHIIRNEGLLKSLQNDSTI
ncbi:MAG TPA: acylneuraminate cytidylyltransferase [Candidatus Omnitrophica bacterium]|nr:acylneuraminate cytidylyltransferase [Candidatus Omnitrophota bacterium]